MNTALLEILKIIGIVILGILLFFAVALLLFFFASVGYYIARLTLHVLIKLERSLFRKTSDRDTSLRSVGGIALIAGIVNGVWMAFPSGMARLSWDLMMNVNRPGEAKALIAHMPVVWNEQVDWLCSYYPLSLHVNRLLAAFLDAAQFTLILPLALAVLSGVVRIWGVPGFFRKAIFFPILLISTSIVFVVASAGIHFISVPLGIAGLVAWFIAVFMLHLPKALSDAMTGATSSSGTQGIESSPGGFSTEDAPSPVSSSGGFAVESQNMFDTELKHRNEWGPDRNLVLDEERSSIYGRVYVDKDSGKTYTETKSDSFNHPTELEENPF